MNKTTIVLLMVLALVAMPQASAGPIEDAKDAADDAIDDGQDAAYDTATCALDGNHPDGQVDMACSLLHACAGDVPGCAQMGYDVARFAYQTAYNAGCAEVNRLCGLPSDLPPI
jgi:hypothetical protein